MAEPVCVKAETQNTIERGAAHRRAAPARVAAIFLLMCFGTACGVEGRESHAGSHAVFNELRGLHDGSGVEATKVESSEPFEWPSGPRPHAVLEIAERGTVRIELYPELAPKTVANFEKLAAEGFYDGTTFHRVIAGFMIQGGDPNSRDDDPANDGQGSPGYTIEDEFSAAPLDAGVLAMANRGSPDSGGAQFFIVHENSPHLTGRYAVFGRVIEGFPHVHAITQVETDKNGRWGPRDRPLEDVVIERVRVE